MGISCISWPLFIHATTFFLLGHSATSATTFGGNETDRQALLAFKYQITHDPLKVMNLWNDSTHFCGWYGVTCSNRHHQRVTSLVLRAQSLTGAISPYIGNLTFLREINLLQNNFNGEIPQEISHLFRLQQLYLGNNSLGGKIPTNLSHCPNLKVIYLRGNMLIGKIPVELGSLLRLTILGLDYNSLSGEIPYSFGNLSSLEVLSISSNSLEGNIPDSLNRLTSLKFFALGLNKLSGMVPLSLYNLSSISTFSLLYNQLYGRLPMDLGFTLPNLQIFRVGYNQFDGPIPVSISNASKLGRLELANNNFSGKVSINWGSLQGLSYIHMSGNYLGSGEVNDLNFLTSLTNCSSLESLGLTNNYFGGELPNSIANLSSQLREMTLGGNIISGSIPTGIGNLVSLGTLGIEYNLLTGNIPNTIGKLHKLQLLNLAGNRLSGKIPSSMGNLTQLSKLYLQENNLNGTIPPSLGNCTSLLLLELSQNNLSGTIPQQVLGLSSLSISLNLSQNNLIGSLPSEVANLNNLAQLDVSKNKLSGEIPNNLGHCRDLLHLYMDGNFFQGAIPSSLIALSALQDLDLSRNNLSGQIPKYLGNFRFLQDLNLSFNDLEGEVPVEGVFKNASEISVAGNNKLCGGIPQLQLPACLNKEPKKKGMSLALKLIVISCNGLLCFILALLFLILYRRIKGRKELLSTSSTRDRLMKISHQELLKATGGFSSANLIGTGSFGTVFKGILDQVESVVAVKVLNLQRHGASRSFMAECEALRNIRHRNLVKVITSCSTIDFQGNNFKAIVYEYMPNGSLERWLHPEADAHDEVKNLNFLQRFNIAIDVAAAMNYLHQYCQTPVIHCDLKPSNILLDNDMTAHVSDFGLARFHAEANNKSSQDQSSSVGIKGTIGYAAPEYGVGSEVSTEGDVYSYGVLLLEIFTGKRPTDDMFKDGLNLHNFAKMALPEQVMEIVDPTLVFVQEVEEEAAANRSVSWKNSRREKIWRCLTSVVKIGVACSMELPRERMNMSDVIRELHLIKDIFIKGWD